MIAQLSEWYGKDVDLTIHIGNFHKHLGMRLDHWIQGGVKINVTEYLSKILEDVPQKHKGHLVMPVANHLFEVGKAAWNLSKDNVQIFYTIVDKVLFLRKLVWFDILTGVALLTTRVIEPEEDDEKKLSHVLKYLKITRELVLTLESDVSGTVKYWMDGSFVVHHDMKIHIGGSMLMGKCAVYCASIKQKLNTKSSTKAELVVWMT